MTFPFPEIEQLWSRLRGHGLLWHITTLNALSGIMRQKAIVPNSGQFQESFPQSKKSYARYLNAVSLCDYDTENEGDILDHLFDVPPLGVLIGIDRNLLDAEKLRLPKQIRARKSPIGELPRDVLIRWGYVPYIEAFYLGAVPSPSFVRYILSATHFFETETVNNVVEVLSSVKAEWDAKGAQIEN